MRVKYQHESTKVLGHSLIYVPSIGSSTTTTDGGSEQNGQVDTESHATGRNWNHNDAVSRGTARSSLDTTGTSETGANNASGGGTIQSSSASHADGLTDTYAERRPTATAAMNSMRRVRLYPSLTVAIGDLTGFGVNLSPMLVPQLGKEAEQPVFLSLVEQQLLAMQAIFSLKNREAFILTSRMTTPVFIRTPDVDRAEMSRTLTTLCVSRYQQESGLSVPADVAIREIVARERRLSRVNVLARADEDFADVR